MPSDAKTLTSLSALERGQRRTWLCLLAPCLIILALLAILPILYSIGFSLYQKFGFSGTHAFVWFQNYSSILGDSEFWKSIRTGAVYAISTTFLQLALGTGAAFLFNRRVWGRGLLRGMIFIPYLVPSVVAVLIWTFLLNGSLGYVNFLLTELGIQPPNWFGEEAIMWTLVLISTWQFFPFVFLSVLARLQSIPHSLSETAELDGASAVRRFLHVYLPQLRTVIVALGALRFVIMFMKFDIPWMLASSQGAGRHIQTPAVYAYRQVFEQLSLGKGFAVTVVYLCFLIVILGVIIKGSRERYEITR